MNGRVCAIAGRRARRGIRIGVLSAIFSLMLCPGANADWTPLRDGAVWSEVGLFYDFRIVRTKRKDGREETAVLDCDRKNHQRLESGARLENASWAKVKDNSIESRVLDYACARRFVRQGSWTNVSDRDPNPTETDTMWTQVGTHRDFRLAWTKRKDDSSEIWLVHCASNSAKMIVSVSATGDETPTNRNWASNRRPFVTYACRRR